MESYITYVMGGLLVAGWVLYETWTEYHQLDYFDPDKGVIIFKGMVNALVYGLLWPTVLILLSLGKMVTNFSEK